MSVKLYVFYDYLKVNGGAEKVFDKLLSIDKSSVGIVGSISEEFKLKSSDIKKVNKLSNESSNSLFAQFFLPYRFSTKEFSGNPSAVTIYSGFYSLFAKAKHNSKLSYYYCHTPPRHWYDLEYFHNKHSNIIMKLGIGLQKLLFKWKYESLVSEMNLVIANSKNVQARIRKYLGVESIVIYPPCEISKYNWIGQGDYYLSTSRLEPYKRVGEIVKAFIQLPDKKLVVTSGGSQLSSLKKLAKKSSNIKFTNWVGEGELAELVGNCIATIYLPIDEDFGISPVESMAAGKPVIGVNEGGVKETVIDSETGILCPKKLKVNHIIEAVKMMTPEYALSLKDNCNKRALLFSSEIFNEKITKLIFDTVEDVSNS